MVDDDRMFGLVLLGCVVMPIVLLAFWAWIKK